MAKGEFWYEAYKKSKAYKEGLRKFQNRLYFNKKFREDFLKSISKTRDDMAEMVEKSREPGTLEEAKWNTFNEQFMDKLSGFDDVGEVVKKFF